MANADKTPLQSRTQATDMERYVLEQMGKMVDSLRTDLGAKMDRSHEQSIVTSAELKLHVAACDRRYAELQLSNDSARTSRAGLLTEVRNVGWLIRLRSKIFEKAVDWALFSLLMAGVFLYKHGWVPPLPTH